MAKVEVIDRYVTSHKQKPNRDPMRCYKCKRPIRHGDKIEIKRIRITPRNGNEPFEKHEIDHWRCGDQAQSVDRMKQRQAVSDYRRRRKREKTENIRMWHVVNKLFKNIHNVDR